MAKRSPQRDQQQRQSRWWSDLPGWLQGVAALLTALVAAAAAFGIINQSNDRPPASITSPTSSTLAVPEVFISSVTATYGKNTTAAGSADSTAHRGLLPNAIEVTGTSRYVSPLLPQPEKKRTPVIVAAAQFKSSPHGLWLVSDPAIVSLNGEWFATIHLRSKQSRSATLTVVALVVPYNSVEAATGGSGAGGSGAGGEPGACLPEDKPCPTGTEPPPTRTQAPPAPSPSAVERHGPKARETIAKSAEKTVSFKRR
jgi:hypothetical protein